MKTLKADRQKRVRIPDAEPGQIFDFESGGLDSVRTLTPVEKRVSRPKLVRRGGRTFLETDRPITDEDVAKALRDFP